MIDHYQIVQQLTMQVWPEPDQHRKLNDFAFELGWRPSDQLQLPHAQGFATAHLIVEHGLQNTAVITFLKTPFRFPELDLLQRKILVGASYNNLIDWHINIDHTGVTYVYNRFTPPDYFSVREAIPRGKVSRLSSHEFQKLAERHPSPNVPSIDDALMNTISLWKRQLSTEIGGLSNESLSALFNAIIFVRAVEDQAKGRLVVANARVPEGLGRQLLVTAAASDGSLPIRGVLEAALTELKVKRPPESIVDLGSLRVFDELDPQLISELLSDFYRNRYQRYYEYDFSLMSKHALSRIYEHYVSILRIKPTPQASLFPKLPEEKIERAYGNVYTPEFIARFFAKYLRKQLPLGSFQKLRVIDPACGSGLFLRTILESQCEALLDNLSTETISSMFTNVIGVDVDVNACQAARLSLSLLSLVLTEEIPSSLEIIQSEAIQFFQKNPEWGESLDAVVTNPPFVNVEAQTDDVKNKILETMGTLAKGRTDLYLAILKVALDLLKPGGFGLFVLPQNFLISENARGMRRFLAEEAHIHCLADLSAVRVFEDVGVYVILLIFQKKDQSNHAVPSAIVMRCQDMVAFALQDVLDGRLIESPYYSVFEADQSQFQEGPWLIQRPHTVAIHRKFESHIEITDLVELRQGIISGADDVFIIPRSSVPKGEEEIFVPFLSDREMEAFTVPRRTSSHVFFPYLDGKPLNGRDIKRQFRQTWEYLLSHRKQLQARRPVESKEVPWWRPTRPRQPANLLRPKIVTPHLVLTPRFSLDLRGKFAVSHSPMVLARFPKGVEDGLKYLLAVLNSAPCFWHISERSHKYQHGYARLEVKTMSTTRVPDPTKVDQATMRLLLRLVDERLEAREEKAFSIENEMNDLVAYLYGLSSVERALVGLRQEGR
jgi:Eco57I restriction-modification methylase